ncbi:MAG: glycerol-3-phosphate responsive antiterminator [Clostridia bacterium]|nr:glycerol-3-phosphate responsive antiterminator [Clostridia bacterium]
MLELEKNPIIAAVHGMEEFEAALESPVDVIFVLNTNIFSVSDYVKRGHSVGKYIFFHADMTEGIAKDSCGVEFLAKAGADGIISTRANMLRHAKTQGLYTVQRFFIIDAQSVKTSIESARIVSPDFIEIMPGIVPKVINHIKDSVSLPIITGGLVETKQEIMEALLAGATAVSTSASSLWDS